MQKAAWLRPSIFWPLKHRLACNIHWLRLYQPCRAEVAATTVDDWLMRRPSRVYKTRLRWRCVSTPSHTTLLSRLASANCCWCWAVFATSTQRQLSTSSSRKPSETFRSTVYLSTSIRPPTCDCEPNINYVITSTFMAFSKTSLNPILK